MLVEKATFNRQENQKVAEHWNRLPREARTAPSPSVFKKCLDNAFGYMVGLLGCPAQGQELDSMILMGPFQLCIFYDSVIYYISMAGQGRAAGQRKIAVCFT